MRSKPLLLLGTALLSVLASFSVTAQQPPGMLATADYLFVVRGEWLFQFDVHSLELRNKVRLDGGAAAELEPVFEIVEEPEALEVAGAPNGMAGDAIDEPQTPRSRADIAQALEAGLFWLATHQDESGKWDADEFMKHDTKGAPCDGAGNPTHDVGATGLAMLAMLGGGSTLRSGPHRDNLKRAATWLRQQQGDNGLFGTNSSNDFIYGHAIATYAMCEAYGLSKMKVLKQAAQKGLNYLEMHRNPYSVWRYQPRDGDNDTSVTAWCLMALKSGKDFGLEVNPNALKLGLAYLDEVTEPDGRCGYTRRGERSSRNTGEHAKRFPADRTEALTAAGLLCRFFLGQNPREHKIMVAAANRLLKQPPKWDPDAGTIDQYYWYFGTYAMYQVGGKHWRAWSKRMEPAVVGSQLTAGNAAGSWDPVGVWGESGGRVYSTALMTLSLEAYYRYARIVR